MAKLTLPRISSGMGSVDLLNAWATLIEQAFENTVSRDGASPNQLEADLDLNGRTVLNTGSSTDPNRVLTFQQMEDHVASVSSGIVIQRQELQTATAAQTVFNLTTMQYAVGTFNLAVYVNGVRKFAPTEYTETTTTRVTFLSGLSNGDKVRFITNEFLGSVSQPDHTHPWSQITNAPVYATRWPTYAEVTDKPATFAPSAHTHAASDIVSGRLADARRGVYVQPSAPGGLGVGDAGVLHFW